jgi:hypothetical protein
MVRQTLIALAAGVSSGLMALSGMPASAQEEGEGIVRVSDCQPAVTSNSGPVYYGDCPDGRCGYGCRGNGAGHIRGVISILCPCGAGLHSPDHGWAPPGRVQLPYPRPVAYQKWFPDQWTGQPGAYGVGGPRPPVVYMPTDTTQLGYYYQTVPRWHAYQGRIPGPPNPAQWHHNLCQLQGANGYGYCPQGNCPNGNYAPAAMSSEITPAPAPTPAVGPAPAPVAPAPAALEKSAQAPDLVPIQ